MRLRLGLLNEDLIERFGVSPTLFSYIFTIWIKLLREVLGKALSLWTPRESLREHLPEIFSKSGYGKSCNHRLCGGRCLLKRPKSLSAQASTWSDYKHHNTFRFLVGITPTGFISFLSSCYGGRASDKFLTRGGGFNSRHDRGFEIEEDLLLHFCRLIIPLGARVKSKMTKSEVKKTKEVANLRIHVETAINRINFFRILKETMVVTMIQHVDDLVLTCAGLYNLKPKFIKSKEKDLQK